MGRKVIALLLVVAISTLLFVGCSSKVSVKDVEKDPNGSIAKGFEKTAEHRSSALYSPLDTASRAAKNGLLSLSFATTNGSKASYEMHQNQKDRQFHTTFNNSSANISWQCALDEAGVFMFRSDPADSWYSLQLQQDHQKYGSTNLGKVLNWTGYDIWSEIQDQYGELVDGVLSGSIDTRSNYQIAADLLLDAIKAESPSSVEDATIDMKTGDRKAIQLVYDIDEQSGVEILDALLSYFDETGTDYDSYLDRICRNAFEMAGCSFCAAEGKESALSQRLFFAEYGVSSYYEEAERETSLTFYVDKESGEVISAIVFSSGKFDGAISSVKGCWTFDTTNKEESCESVTVSMDCFNASVDSFELLYVHSVSDGSSNYSSSTTRTCKTLSDIVRNNSYLSYDKVGGNFEMVSAAGGRDVTLRGNLADMQKELRMTIGEMECEGVTAEPIHLDVSLLAVPDEEVPSVNAKCKTFEGLSEADTLIAHEKFVKTMPTDIFGEWEPSHSLDQKFYDEFDVAYDYNKDGAVDEKDKHYYEHMHAILTAPVE